jgi:hypothetical protein
MALEDAAKSLADRLREAPWLTAVGVGQEAGAPCIVVYVKTLQETKLDFLKGGWEGYPVLVRKMGTPRLVASFWPQGSGSLGRSG